MDGVQSLGDRLASSSYRVLLHDRRNCGASEAMIDGDEAEFVIAADDFHELLSQQVCLAGAMAERKADVLAHGESRIFNSDKVAVVFRP